MSLVLYKRPCSHCGRMTGQMHEVKSEGQRREEGKTDEPRVAYETDEHTTYHIDGVFYKQYKLPFNEHPKE